MQIAIKMLKTRSQHREEWVPFVNLNDADQWEIEHPNGIVDIAEIYLTHDNLPYVQELKAQVAKLEAELQKRVNAHSQTTTDLRNVGRWLQEAEKTIDSLRASWRDAEARVFEREQSLANVVTDYERQLRGKEAELEMCRKLRDEARAEVETLKATIKQMLMEELTLEQLEALAESQHSDEYPDMEE